MNADQIESSQTLIPLRGGYKNKRHGHWCNGHATPEYACWHSMKQRCLNPNWGQFRLYGGRGITVCERWMKFENFLADMGLRPSAEHSIERRDSNGNYEKTNCYWATRIQQMRNTRRNLLLTLNGETHCAVEWAEKLGVRENLITKRKERGWSDEDALLRPPIRSNRRPK